MNPSTSLRTRKKLVVGNWKMFIEFPDDAKTYVQGLRRAVSRMQGVDAWVAPPFTLLSTVAAATKGSSTIKVGAQTTSSKHGAHTGEVSPQMIKGVGGTFVIIGHSERRASGTTEEEVHDQLVLAAREGLAPILCIGESERSAEGAHWSVLESQLRSALRGTQGLTKKLIVAYEPLWAIGKSAADAMQPQELEETAIFIRKTLAEVVGREIGVKVPILYGGSVEPENASALLGAGINGFLVGHSSAQLDSFKQILKAAALR